MLVAVFLAFKLRLRTRPYEHPSKTREGCNNLTSCMYVTSLVYISMPLILKINIVITTQRACPILQNYNVLNMMFAQNDRHVGK